MTMPYDHDQYEEDRQFAIEAAKAAALIIKGKAKIDDLDPDLLIEVQQTLKGRGAEQFEDAETSQHNERMKRIGCLELLTACLYPKSSLGEKLRHSTRKSEGSYKDLFNHARAVLLSE